MRTIDKLERHTVVAGTLKQELLKRQYVVFGSKCVNFKYHMIQSMTLPSFKHRIFFILSAVNF